MKKIAIAATALAAAAALALAGCSGPGRTADESAGASGGFDQGSLIGVALPSKTSENWVLAGDLFKNDLTSAGFKADVQYAGSSTPVADQQAQIQSMVTKGAKVIIVGAADGGQLADQVKAAHDAGVTVIAYDRLILNSPNVDYYVAYDNFKVGELQGKAILDGMKAKWPDTKQYNIELFSGSPDDANSKVFFDGAMSVLNPAIKDGTVKVASGQTAIKQTATQGWKAENAQNRMDSLLNSTYGNKDLNGVLSPNDTLARAILTSVKAAGKPTPIVSGQDSEVESVKSIAEGKQYMTINKDTRALVKQAVNMTKQLQAGATVSVNDTKSYNNGVKVVPTYLLPPMAVTKANLKEAYANDPTLSKIVAQYDK